MIFDLYYISCIYVKPMNCMVPGNKQSNLYIETQLFLKNCQTSIQNIYLKIDKCLYRPTATTLMMHNNYLKNTLILALMYQI